MPRDVIGSDSPGLRTGKREKWGAGGVQASPIDGGVSELTNDDSVGEDYQFSLKGLPGYEASQPEK